MKDLTQEQKDVILEALAFFQDSLEEGDNDFEQKQEVIDSVFGLLL